MSEESSRAISERNAEVVRDQIAAFNMGDFAAAIAALDEDVEWQVPQIATLDAPALGVIRGRQTLVENLTQWFDAWETYAFQATEVRGHGEHVFVAGTQTGWGRNSGIDVTERTFHVFTLRGRKIARMRTFSDRTEALGLRT